MKTEKFLAIFFILSIIFFFFAATARAEVTTGDESVNVNISNTTDGNSSVNVESHVSASTSTSSNTTSETNVRVEQNGKVTQFNSEGEDIDYTSEDGSVKVKVNNNQTSPTDSSPTSAATKSPTPTESEEVLGESSEEYDEFMLEIAEDKKELQKDNLFWRLFMATPGPFNSPFQLTILLLTLNYLF